jgi:chromosome partitioning protein
LLIHGIFIVNTYRKDWQMIVTVGATKGGVGKTTVALNLALGRALAGRDVWLVDGDRQGTAQTAVSIRADEGKAPALACSQYVDGPTLRSQVQHQRDKYQDIIIDAGGRDSTALRAALTLCDVLVIPFQPRSFDLWAMQDVLTLVNEARSVRDGLRVYALLNLADPQGSDNAEAAEVVKGLEGIELLPVTLGRRKAFSSAAGSGLSVMEMSPKDPKACNEIQSLFNCIFIGN